MFDIIDYIYKELLVNKNDVESNNKYTESIVDGSVVHQNQQIGVVTKIDNNKSRIRIYIINTKQTFNKEIHRQMKKVKNEE